MSGKPLHKNSDGFQHQNIDLLSKCRYQESPSSRIPQYQNQEHIQHFFYRHEDSPSYLFAPIVTQVHEKCKDRAEESRNINWPNYYLKFCPACICCNSASFFFVRVLCQIIRAQSLMASEFLARFLR